MPLSIRKLFGPRVPLPTPRDRHLDADYWQRSITILRKLVDSHDRTPQWNQSDRAKRTQWRFDFGVRPATSLVWCLYSGGYPLSAVMEAISQALAFKRDLDEDFRAANPRRPWGLYGWVYEVDYAAMLQEMGWVACLFGSKALEAYVERCNPAGEDHLFDMIAATVDATRPVGSMPEFHKRFIPLLDVVEAPSEARSTLLVEYFKGWKRRLPDGGRPKAGAATILDGAYKGHWCLEAALVAARFDVDDSALQSDPHYPGDIVAYYRASPDSIT